MKVIFYSSDKPHERVLADAFKRGCAKHDDTCEVIPLAAEFKEDTFEPQDCDVAVMVGVKSKSLFQKHHKRGMHIVYFDKGYTRHRNPNSPIRVWEYWRVSVDAHQPTNYIMKKDFPSDRWDKFGFEPLPWRKEGRHIIIAGSSAKYHSFFDLWDPNRYWAKTVHAIKKISPHRPIVYRPKPSYKDAVPIEGTDFSRGESIMDVLREAHVLVTHGSNACFESIIAGVPCIVLGDAVARPLSSTELIDIENPKICSEEMRRQWFYNLAYQQWTMPEVEAGEMWQHTRPLIYG